MLIVGLTGGIATGKSTVSERLREKHNLTLVDADAIAHQVQLPGTRPFNKIVEHFGSKISNLLNEDGTLNRPALGRYVFGKHEELLVLNSIVHPAVRLEIFKQLFWAYITFQRMVILDVPLLFEAGLDKICGTTVVVICTEEVQLERLLKRNKYLTLEDAKQRVHSQMSNYSRIRKADHVIDNSTTIDSLNEQIDGVLRKIRPNLFLYLLECFPPFGFLSAIATFIIRRLYEWDSLRSRSE